MSAVGRAREGVGEGEVGAEGGRGRVEVAANPFGCGQMGSTLMGPLPK